ncbi:MAG: hypothetical protein HYT62_03115 [Candidatus Yanofskybacteria bacterium]|nr:hypothetical protein [Candidatus Yanofskybacteria bacterium]
MGLFTSAKPKITEKEITELGNALENQHSFNQNQRKFVVDVVLKPHVEKSPYESTPAISKEEAMRIKELLADKNSGVHTTLKEKNISDAEIDNLSKEIDKFLIINH